MGSQTIWALQHTAPPHPAGTAAPHSLSSSSDMCALYDEDDDTAPFATPDTLASCSQYLEATLRDLGLRQWQLLGGDAVAALNCLYDLVQQHQRMQEAREAQQDDLHKAKVDVKLADKTIQRLQGQLEAKQQELGAANIKLRQLESWYRDETERWSCEREELCKKCSQLEQRHSQWQHELRRRNAEFERLQKHLATHITANERRRRASGGGAAGAGGGCSGSGGTIVLASAGAGSIKHGRGPVGGGSGSCSSKPCSGGSHSQPDLRRISKAELEDLHKRSLEAFKAERQGLERDNAALRKALQSLEREHKELLNTTQTATRSSGAGSGSEPKAGTTGSGSDARCSAGDDGAGGGGSPAAAAAAVQQAAADPAAALHKMHTNLQALRVRKQRVTGGAPLSELQQQAESASERLLLVKLQEAGRIMEEQETALALALQAVSHTGEDS